MFLFNVRVKVNLNKNTLNCSTCKFYDVFELVFKVKKKVSGVQRKEK